MRPNGLAGVEILSDALVGRDGGFLALRRLRMANIRGDGTRSASYLVDYLVRPTGIDAVAVVIYCREGGRVRVLLRDGLRPPLVVGRPDALLPVPDARRYLLFREIVAGIVEEGDRGEEGLRRRAAMEIEEETGFRVAPEAVRFLGASFFPSPGAMAERVWLLAVEVASTAAGATPAGDGSPMEECAELCWLDLDQAIQACVGGEIEDGKTELGLRRLRDRLASR